MEFIVYLIVSVGVVMGLSFGSYKLYEFYAPRYAEIDRQVWLNTQSYNEGMIRDLENLKSQYEKADGDSKSALRAVIQHRFSVYPEDRLPLDLRSFYNSLR